MMYRLWTMMIVFLCSCQQAPVNNFKDLEQNMMDLKLYQENMGDLIKAGRLQDASWLLEGTDSVLQVVAQKFTGHHKLDRPFSHFYKKDMKAPLSGIRKAIEDNDTAAARKSYRVLVKNCNGCHIDHEIDKEVFY